MELFCKEGKEIQPGRRSCSVRKAKKYNQEGKGLKELFCKEGPGRQGINGVAL